LPLIVGGIPGVKRDAGHRTPSEAGSGGLEPITGEAMGRSAIVSGFSGILLARDEPADGTGNREDPRIGPTGGGTHIPTLRCLPLDPCLLNPLAHARPFLLPRRGSLSEEPESAKTPGNNPRRKRARFLWDSRESVARKRVDCCDRRI